jgi:hypothetical protein
LVSGRYPFVMKSADQFHVDKLEFLDRSHPTYDLRPKTALEVTFGFYSLISRSATQAARDL